MQKNIEENNEKDIVSYSLFYIFLFLIAIINLPIFITAFICYFLLFRLLKQKPLVNGLISSLLLLALYIIAIFIEPYKNLKLELSNLLMPYLFTSLYIGIIIGYIWILFEVYKFKKYPELKNKPGWRNNFSYNKSPFDKLKIKFMKKEIKNEYAYNEEFATIGISTSPVTIDKNKVIDKPHIVSRYYREAVKGTILTGSSGSGKTTTMLNLIRNDILAGLPVIAIDFKKGPDLAYKLSKWAKENNRQFYHFFNGPKEKYNNPFCKEKASYDPLSSGDRTSKVDMVLNMREWDGASEIYKKRTQSILQTIFFLLDKVNKEELKSIDWNSGGFSLLLSVLDINNIYQLVLNYKKNLLGNRTIENLNPNEQRRLKEIDSFYFELEKNKDLRSQLDSLKITCRNLLMSDYGSWLSKGISSNHIDLLNIALLDEAPVVLFQLNPNNGKNFAKELGYIILEDLKRISAIKSSIGNHNYVGLYIDEFQTLDISSISGILEKARDAGFLTTLSIQSLEQIVSEANKNGDAYLESLLGIISNFIVHAGSTSKSALRFSEIIGKIETVEYNFTKDDKDNEKVTTNNKTIFKVPPEEFLFLTAPNKIKPSKAVYITKSHCEDPLFKKEYSTIARTFEVIVPDEILTPIPNEFKFMLGEK